MSKATEETTTKTIDAAQPVQLVDLDEPINDIGFTLSALSLIHDDLCKDNGAETTSRDNVIEFRPNGDAA
jgi:hypothetical protein